MNGASTLKGGKSTTNNKASGDITRKPLTAAQKAELVNANGGQPLATEASLDPNANRGSSNFGDWVGDVGNYFVGGGPLATVLDKAGLGYAADMASGGPLKRFGNAVVTGVGTGDFKPAAQAFLNPGGTPIANAVFGNVPGAVAAPTPFDIPRPGAGAAPGINAGTSPAAPAPAAGPAITGGPVAVTTGGGTGAPGVLTTPGEGEQWWADHKGYYDKPTNLQGYWEGLQGGMQPNATQSAWGQNQDWYNKGSTGAQNASEISTNLRDRNGGEKTLGEAKNYFTGDNQTYNYNKAVGDTFKQEGTAETYAKSNMGGLTQSGQGGQGVYKTMGDWATPGAAENNNTTAQRTLAGSNATRNFNTGMQNSGFTQKNTTGSEFDYFQPELRQKSRSEDLYDSGQGGQALDTYYDRQSQKQSKALTDQMAAMGVFGSGATARGLSEMHADLGASQARDMAGLAAQADNAFLGRTGSAQSFSSAAGDENIKRYGLGLQSAQASDESTRGNVGLANQASQNAENASIDRMFKGGTLGLAADQEARQRLELGGVFANNAQSQQLDRLKAGGDLAKASDASVFDQGRGLADIGTAQSTQELNRLQQSTTAGLSADQELRARNDANFKNAQGLDDQNLKNAEFNKGVQVDLDAQNYARQTAGQDAANGVQNLFETRQRYGIKDKQTLADSLSSLVMGVKNKSADEQAAMSEEIINSYMAETGVDRAAAEQYAQQLFQAAGIALKVGEKKGK